MSTEDGVRRVLDGQSWAEFCDTLKAAGEVVLREATPAECWRYLSRLTRTALEQHLEFADPKAPAFRRPSHETVKIGADNPDSHDQSATIDGAYRYRIRGLRHGPGPRARAPTARILQPHRATPRSVARGESAMFPCLCKQG